MWTDTNCGLCLIYVLNSLCGPILIVICRRQHGLIGVIIEPPISISCSGEESNWASAE